MILEYLKDPVWQYYLSVLIGLWPVARIFRRAGFSPWLAAFLFIPMLGYVVCAGLLTFRRWPLLQKKTGEAS